MSRYFFMAWGLLGRGRRNIRRFILGALGIGLSLVPLIFVDQVAEGMIEGITSRFVALGGGAVRLYAVSDGGPASLEPARAAIDGRADLGTAYPVYEGIGILGKGSDKAGVAVKGLPSHVTELDRDFGRFMEIIDGSFDLSGRNDVVLGKAVAQQLGLTLGDRCVLLLPATSESGRDILRPTFLTVSGIAFTGYHELDRLTVYVSTERARSFSSGEWYLSVQGAGRDAGALQRGLRREFGEDFVVRRWDQIHGGLIAGFEGTRRMLFVIMALVVLVAGVNISSNLVHLVSENAKEVAVLRSTGTTGRQILGVFFLMGAMLGITGTAIGSLIGVVLALSINDLLGALEGLGRAIEGISQSGVNPIDLSFYLDTIPITLTPAEVLLPAAWCLLVCLVGAMIPSGRAAAIRPHRVLSRY